MKKKRGMASKTKSPKDDAVEKDVGQFVNNAIGIMYDDQQYEKSVAILKDESMKPIERVAAVGVPIVSYISDTALKSGVKLGFETLSNSAPIVVSEILQIAEKEGAFTLDENEQQAALTLSVQDYMTAEFAKGTYDKDAIAREMSEAVNRLPPEQQEELEKQGQNAQAGIDKQMGAV